MIATCMTNICAHISRVVPHSCLATDWKVWLGRGGVKGGVSIWNVRARDFMNDDYAFIVIPFILLVNIFQVCHPRD